MSTQHKKLVDTFESCMQELEGIGDKLNWDSKEAYGAWLTQTYHYVSHSTRLLALAAARFDLTQNKLHSRFIEHLREEKGHEVLATNDLKQVGKTLNDFSEFAETAAFYQTQYFWIEHVSPMAFYGYILCLEGYAVRRGGHFFKHITQNFGDKTASFLKVHKDEDTDHLAKAFDQLKALPEKDLECIEENLKQSCQLYGLILKRVWEMEQTSRKVKRAAA